MAGAERSSDFPSLRIEAPVASPNIWKCASPCNSAEPCEFAGLPKRPYRCGNGRFISIQMVGYGMVPLAAHEPPCPIASHSHRFTNGQAARDEAFLPLELVKSSLEDPRPGHLLLGVPE
jgi:hypothetical protein